ncbi:MAG: DUF4760 domain-containing protein [Oscillatoriophycideae cyanobacterium NC_groundwater_1537_Pr4_S-0.65um_50_18]|nr:DUF4760 domain-containing protein [Oscillatoriophycideae cyanobacterium NC_groundwater_1537_Pr4_S-0.65um_50_18]
MTQKISNHKEYGYSSNLVKLPMCSLGSNKFSLSELGQRLHRLGHVDFAPQLLFIGFFVFLTMFIYPKVIKDSKPKDVFDATTSVGTILSLIFTAYNIHVNYDHSKRDKASHYIEVWYKNELSKEVDILRNIKEEEYDRKLRDKICKDSERSYEYTILDLKKDGNKIFLDEVQTKILLRLQRNTNERKSVNKVLAFFEHMSQDVKSDVVDEEYLREYLFLIVINYYELLKKYIQYVQYKFDSPTTYCNFVHLAEFWGKYRNLPKLPQMCCQIEVVLSRDDLQSINSIRQEKIVESEQG